MASGETQKSEGARERGEQSKRPYFVLRVEMAGGPTVGEVVAFLAQLRATYSRIDTFFLRTPRPKQAPLGELIKDGLAGHRMAGSDLVLGQVAMRSPGPWDFIGNLNPLKVMADYLQQRHERKKDNTYRNRAEEERLALENALLQNRVLRERVELLERAGMSSAEIQLRLRAYIAEPLSELGPYVDSGLIGETEINPRNEPAA